MTGNPETRNERTKLSAWSFAKRSVCGLCGDYLQTRRKGTSAPIAVLPPVLMKRLRRVSILSFVNRCPNIIRPARGLGTGNGGEEEILYPMFLLSRCETYTSTI